tara:strand:- start:157 stop:315 length:159 start_codon:yes stop_codon:yes gene_type:complete
MLGLILCVNLVDAPREQVKANQHEAGRNGWLVFHQERKASIRECIGVKRELR